MNESPAWARGQDLAFLKEAAALFALAHKPHVYGAFGLVKERDIAAALSTGGFFFVRRRGKLVAAAIGHELRSNSQHTDFSGRSIRLGYGEFYIKSFAAADERAAVELLRHIKRYSTVVEIFEEDLVAKTTFADFRYIGSKVTAGGEIKGVYRSWQFADNKYPEVERLTLHEISRQFLNIGSLAKIRQELSRTAKHFAQHYSSYNKRHSWSAFSLRGFRPVDPSFIIKPAEMSQAWKKANPDKVQWKCANTELMARFPTVRKVLKEIPCAGFERIRFMRLAEKNGELSRHADITDRLAGPQLGKVIRLHVPIYTHRDVQFLAWDERGNKLCRTMTEGSLWYLDVRKPHSVINRSDEPRVHLVIDAICSKETLEWLCPKK